MNVEEAKSKFLETVGVAIGDKMDKIVYTKDNLSEDFVGSHWIMKSGFANEMSHLGVASAEILNIAFYGLRNLNPTSLRRVEWDNDYWIGVTIFGGISTVDDNKLTRMVVLSFDMAIRFTIEAAANNYLRLIFHSRQREGRFSEACKPLEQSISDIRGGFDLVAKENHEALLKLRKAHL